jgi:hypothetical protein
MFAFDFGESLGVYSPERMFSKRTKKDPIFGMTYTRRKKKAKSFLG